MHEFSIVTQLVKVAVKSAEENGVTEVHSITIQLGELSFLASEQMDFAFGVLSRETILEGAKLIFEEVRATIECPSCGYKGPLPKEKMEGLDHYFPVLMCPECGGRPSVTAGKECIISEMSAEV